MLKFLYQRNDLMKKTILLLVLPLIFTSCFKTAEEIKREKQIDHQLRQSSEIIARLTSQISELKGNLATTSGQIEEIDHKRKQNTEEQQLTFTQRIDLLSERVKLLTEENTETKSQIKELTQKVENQKKFIKKVTGTLSKMSGTSSSSKGNSLLQKAHKAFEKNKQKQAKSLYLEVLQENKVSNSKKNHIFFNLGLLDYWNKNYDQALVYFSKIYTKYPRSSFAPRALLYIARSFKKANRSDEATASYQELIKSYPKSKQAKSAAKELK
jgi:TolA-binding protein